MARIHIVYVRRVSAVGPLRAKQDRVCVDDHGSTVTFGVAATVPPGGGQLIDYGGNLPIEPLAVPAGPYRRPRVSPDGKRLAVGIDEDTTAEV